MNIISNRTEIFRHGWIFMPDGLQGQQISPTISPNNIPSLDNKPLPSPIGEGLEVRLSERGWG